MKKKSVIRQLMVGEPDFFERGKLTDEQSRLMDVLSDLEIEVNNKFGDDKSTLELIKKYIDALDELNLEETSCLFEKGVKFGVLLGMELAEE